MQENIYGQPDETDVRFEEALDDLISEESAAKGAPSPAPKKAKAEKQKKVKPPKAVKEKPAYAPDYGFTLADGEEVVTTYDCTRGGRLTVTNKRVLYADTANNRKEAFLENVSSIESSFKVQFRFFSFLFFFVFAAVCALPFIMDFTRFIPNCPAFVKYVFWGIGGLFGIFALCMLFRIRSLKFVFTINSFAGNSFLNICAGNKISLNNTIIDRPGKEAKKMMKEIGAVLIEANRR